MEKSMSFMAPRFIESVSWRMVNGGTTGVGAFEGLGEFSKLLLPFTCSGGGV